MRDSEVYEQSYAGNDSVVTPYQIQFRFLEAEDLAVIVTDAAGAQDVLTPETDYTVTRDTVTELGSFVTTDAIPVTSTVKVYRDNRVIQQLDYVNGDTFPADSHESGMDRLTEAIQAVRAIAMRSLRVSPASEELEFETSSTEPNTVAGLGADSELIFRTAAEMVSFLSLSEPIINFPTKTWANNGERALAVPDFIGQVGTQRDTGSAYISTGVAAGNWSPSVASTVADLSVTREKIADGALTADVLGRAKMADLFITFAKMNTDFVTAMTEKSNLASGDFIPGYSTADTAFRKYAGSTIIPVGSVIQTIFATPYVANTNISTVIPVDDTIPQIVEGTQILTLTITPRFSNSIIRLTSRGFGGTGAAAAGLTAALFRVPVTNCLQVHECSMAAGSYRQGYTLDWPDEPATTSATTYTVRVGPGTAGTIRMNGHAAARMYGGKASCTLVAQEIKV